MDRDMKNKMDGPQTRGAVLSDVGDESATGDEADELEVESCLVREKNNFITIAGRVSS